MTSEPKKILIVTTSRADWGILSVPARMLALNPSVRLKVLAGNMHTSPKYGATVAEIKSEGIFDIIEATTPEVDDTPASRTAIMAGLANATADILRSWQPDAVVVLGDRYEIIGVATAALLAGIPLAHLHGGEVTLGAMDDNIRNAVSQMATLHFTATEAASERLVDMNIDARSIHRIGAIGVESIVNTNIMDVDELKDSLDGFDIDRERTLLVTFHPVTRHPERISCDRQLDNMLGALDDVAPYFNAIITAPNNDPGGEVIMKRLVEYAALHPERVKFVKSLGHRRYLSAMHHVRAVVGNTSSGIIEAPSTPAATIDIGPRQEGRERASAVIHVGDNRNDIANAINGLRNVPAATANPLDNPYYKPGSARAFVDILLARI